MALNVITYSMEEFIELGINDDTLNSNNYYICIHSNDWIHSVPVFKQEHKNVLNLWFEDVEQTGLKVIPWFNSDQKVIYAKAITKQQANELYNFIKTIPENSTVHIYCAKGRSRSVAVKNFILTHINHDTNVDLSYHNKYVYKLLQDIDARL